jgi:hypothetical protein
LVEVEIGDESSEGGSEGEEVGHGRPSELDQNMTRLRGGMLLEQMQRYRE